MSNADIYIQKYKELEQIVRENYNLKNGDSIRMYLNRKEEFKYCREELNYCQDVRNLLQHRQKISNKYPIEPTNEMIAYLEQLIEKMRNRKTCGDVAVPAKSIYKRKINDTVKPVMQTMKKMGYTHVPIYESGSMTGVFSDRSMFAYMIDHEWAPLTDNLTFADLRTYISLDKHEHECFRFVSESLYVDELKELMEEDLHRSCRTVMVFVTLHGNEKERILGIITPWMIL